ncbi:MAG: hypothetical protein KJ686_02885 [Actinobacteria bacterium]|nr:hypothetical protein [Actinomycetota bacterium]
MTNLETGITGLTGGLSYDFDISCEGKYLSQSRDWIDGDIIPALVLYETVGGPVAYSLQYRELGRFSRDGKLFCCMEYQWPDTSFTYLYDTSGSLIQSFQLPREEADIPYIKATSFTPDGGHICFNNHTYDENGERRFVSLIRTSDGVTSQLIENAKDVVFSPVTRESYPPNAAELIHHIELHIENLSPHYPDSQAMVREYLDTFLGKEEASDRELDALYRLKEVEFLGKINLLGAQQLAPMASTGYTKTFKELFLLGLTAPAAAFIKGKAVGMFDKILKAIAEDAAKSIAGEIVGWLVSEEYFRDVAGRPDEFLNTNLQIVDGYISSAVNSAKLYARGSYKSDATNKEVRDEAHRLAEKQSEQVSFLVSLWDYYDRWADVPIPGISEGFAIGRFVHTYQCTSYLWVKMTDIFGEFNEYAFGKKPRPRLPEIAELRLHSPANLALADKEGKLLAGKWGDKEEADDSTVFYTGSDLEQEVIIIPDPEDEYRVVLTGTDEGTYHLSCRTGYEYKESEVIKKEGRIKKGETVEIPLSFTEEKGETKPAFKKRKPWCFLLQGSLLLMLMAVFLGLIARGRIRDGRWRLVGEDREKTSER